MESGDRRRRVVVTVSECELEIQQRELELAVLSVLSTLLPYEQDVLARVVESGPGFEDLQKAAEEIHQDLRFIPSGIIQALAERALARLREPERARILAPYLPEGRRESYVIM